MCPIQKTQKSYVRRHTDRLEIAGNGEMKEVSYRDAISKGVVFPSQRSPHRIEDINSYMYICGKRSLEGFLEDFLDGKRYRNDFIGR